MAFRYWQLGLHIQHEGIFIVALQRGRSGWALKRWWHLPLTVSSDQNDSALLETLIPWRRELPWQHTVSFAFPANRTLQKTLPLPTIALRETEQKQWIASTMSQQLEMEPNALCFDYYLAEPEGCWHVTAAQHNEVARLQRLAQQLRLQVAAITPDACALQTFLPLLAENETTLVWRDHQQWLWANRKEWGHCSLTDIPSVSHLSARLAISPEALVCCSSALPSARYFDPWEAISQKYPPLPIGGEGFAVAIALAMGAPSI